MKPSLHTLIEVEHTSVHSVENTDRSEVYSFSCRMEILGTCTLFPTDTWAATLSIIKLPFQSATQSDNITAFHLQCQQPSIARAFQQNWCKLFSQVPFRSITFLITMETSSPAAPSESHQLKPEGDEICRDKYDLETEIGLLNQRDN